MDPKLKDDVKKDSKEKSGENEDTVDPKEDLTDDSADETKEDQVKETDRNAVKSSDDSSPDENGALKSDPKAPTSKSLAVPLGTSDISGSAKRSGTPKSATLPLLRSAKSTTSPKPFSRSLRNRSTAIADPAKQYRRVRRSEKLRRLQERTSIDAPESPEPPLAPATVSTSSPPKKKFGSRSRDTQEPRRITAKSRMKRSKKSQRKTLAERKKEEPKKTMAEKCRIFWGRIPIASTVAAAIIVISLTVLLISAETGLIYMDEAFRMIQKFEGDYEQKRDLMISVIRMGSYAAYAFVGFFIIVAWMCSGKNRDCIKQRCCQQNMLFFVCIIMVVMSGLYLISLLAVAGVGVPLTVAATAVTACDVVERGTKQLCLHAQFLGVAAVSNLCKGTQQLMQFCQVMEKVTFYAWLCFVALIFANIGMVIGLTAFGSNYAYLKTEEAAKRNEEGSIQS